MKRKGSNPYDVQFDHLYNTLSGVKDIDKLLATEGGQRFMQFISIRQYELNGLVALYKKVIMPAVNRNIAEQTRLWRQSRYGRIVQLSDEQLREDKYMVIRLAYGQLYHRYESFINDLFPHCEQLVDDPVHPPGGVYEYIRTKHEVDLKRPSYHPTLREVNYVANCVKHTNGLPTRTPIPGRFKGLDKSMPIRIPDAELYRDMEGIRDLMAQVIQQVLRAHQILLYRDMTTIGSGGPLQQVGVAATDLLETLLKGEFQLYKNYYLNAN